MSITLWAVLGFLAQPASNLADEWCAGRSGQEAEVCANACGTRPVHQLCHIIVRFGLKGIEVGMAADKTGVPVARVAATRGFKPSDSETLAIFYEMLGNSSLPVSYDQTARIAEADAAFLKASQARDGGRFLMSAAAFEEAASLYTLALGRRHYKAIAARVQQYRVMVRGDQHAEAIRLLEQTVSDVERLLGSHHPALATLVLELAELLCQRRACANAEPLYLRVLAINEMALGHNHLEVAVSLRGLADLYSQTGVYQKAEPLYVRALDIYKKALGPVCREVAATLHDLADLHEDMGELKKAETLYLRSLTINEKALGPDHSTIAPTLNNLALLYQKSGAHDKAEPLYHRALTVTEKALGPDDPAVATILHNFAKMYQETMAYGQSETLSLRALAIKEKALGPDSIEVAATLHSLAGLYEETEAYEKAEILYLSALAINEKVLGTDDPEVSVVLDNLAGLYQKTGSYEKGEVLYLRALAIKERLGPSHPKVAVTLTNLAVLYTRMSMHEKARVLYLRALDIFEKELGQDDPQVAATLNNLAALYSQTGDYNYAEASLLRALNIFKKALGSDSLEVATILNNLAGLYYAMKEYEKVEPQLRRALAIFEKGSGANDSQVAVTAHNIGVIKSQQHAYADAIPFLERAARIHERVLPPHHPHRSPVAQSLGIVLLQLGRVDDARRWLSVAEETDQTHFQAVVDTVHADTEIVSLYQQRLPSFARAISLYEAELGFAAALRWQGAALSAEMRWRDLRRIEQAERAAQTTAPKTVKKPRMQAFREASSAHLRLLRTAPATPALKAAHAAALAAAETELKRLEAALAADHPDFARRRELPQATPGDVCAALHRQGGVPLLDYVRHLSLDPAAKGIEFVPHDLAFVVEPVAGGACYYHRVDLGAAKRLDDAYREWREAITAAEVCYADQEGPGGCRATFTAVDGTAAKLRAMVWDPVAAWLTHHPRILLVPDGPLVSVPFGSLPIADGNGYLAERHAFTVLSFPAAAILLEADKALGTAAGALVVGDVNYTLTHDSERAANNLRTCRADGCDALTAEQRASFAATEEQRRTELVVTRKRDPLAGAPCGPDHVEWVALPSDIDEDSGRPPLEALAADLAATLAADTTLVTDATATEPVVTALMRARRIIHLQTHGYAIDPEAQRDCAKRHAVVKARPHSDPSPLLDAENNDRQVFDPQRLAGLIFAGRKCQAAIAALDLAEQQQTTIDPALQKAAIDCNITSRTTPNDRSADGLLIAREILNLDLTGTLLVVLAACQSGLGLQVTGEGALGLGRAFLVAGARYAVVSHWQVPFKATSRMFTAFYRRVAAGTEPAIALQQAQIEAINEWSDPQGANIQHSAFLWGAFVPLVGR